MEIGSKKEYSGKKQIEYDFDTSVISLAEKHLKFEGEIIRYDEIEMLRLRHFYRWWFWRGYKRLEIYVGDTVFCTRLELRPVPLSKAMVHYDNEKMVKRFKSMCQKLLSHANKENNFWLVMYYNKYLYYTAKYTIYAWYSIFAWTGITILIKIMFSKTGFAKALMIPSLLGASIHMSNARNSLDMMSPPIQIKEDNLDDAFEKFLRI